MKDAATLSRPRKIGIRSLSRPTELLTDRLEMRSYRDKYDNRMSLETARRMNLAPLHQVVSLDRT